MLAASVLLTAFGGTTWLLANTGEAPWPTWIALPANLGAVALLLWLMLTGRQVRREDVTALMGAERARGDERVAEVEKRAKERTVEAERREALLRERLEAVVADRNAWREAHHQETMARATAEQTTTKLLSATDVTVRLLDALERSVVANHPPPGTG